MRPGQCKVQKGHFEAFLQKGTAERLQKGVQKGCRKSLFDGTSETFAKMNIDSCSSNEAKSKPQQ